MKFLADVNIPQSVIVSLTNLGHNVLDVKDKNINARDTEIIELAKQENRVILTRDKDFLALVQFPKYQAATIVIRLRDQTPKHILEKLIGFVENQKESTIKKSITIVKEESADSYPYSLDKEKG